ncbi:MAG TPA: ABC transporter permease subunit [Baekduia sp.]|nr:ABC transporter permease subunit [Baekduia sp.]
MSRNPAQSLVAARPDTELAVARTDADRPRLARRGPRSSAARPGWVTGTASVLIILVALELAGRVGIFDRSRFPLVSDVLRRLASEATGSDLWTSTGQTLVQAIAGLVLGTLIAVPLGLALGRVALLEQAFRPVIEFLRPIPSIAILPLVIFTLGVGFRAAVLLIALSSLWLVLVLTIRGARAVDPVARDALVAFGVPRHALIRHLVVPSASPFIVTGVRIAASVALVVAITVELLGGMPGLGKQVTVSLQGADQVGVYSYTVAAGLLGLVLNLVMVPLEDRLLSWHPSRRWRA